MIGKGSYGVVCSAIDNFTGEKVAIKKINNVFEHVSDATRILREIKLLRLLKHPGQQPPVSCMACWVFLQDELRSSCAGVKLPCSCSERVCGSLTLQYTSSQGSFQPSTTSHALWVVTCMQGPAHDLMLQLWLSQRMLLLS